MNARICPTQVMASTIAQGGDQFPLGHVRPVFEIQLLRAIVKALQELPGQELFQYQDKEGKRQRIESADVNAFLRTVAGDDFTAKDFRTWAATVLAAWALNEFQEIDSEAAAQRNIVRAVKRVAKQLGNTLTVCRQSYIHPEVLDAYLDGSLIKALKQPIKARLRTDLPGLEPDEVAVLLLLRDRLERES